MNRDRTTDNGKRKKLVISKTMNQSPMENRTQIADEEQKGRNRGDEEMVTKRLIVSTNYINLHARKRGS